MAFAGRLATKLPRMNGSRNLLRDLWNLRAGYAEVRMADRRAVRNHLDSVHAVALANLAELAGNVALMYSLPDDARFIMSGMEIEYLKKRAERSPRWASRRCRGARHAPATTFPSHCATPAATRWRG